jgi:hypothetical protein
MVAKLRCTLAFSHRRSTTGLDRCWRYWAAESCLGRKTAAFHATELSETQLISAHLSMPDVAQHEPSERLLGFS